MDHLEAVTTPFGPASDILGWLPIAAGDPVAEVFPDRVGERVFLVRAGHEADIVSSHLGGLPAAPLGFAWPTRIDGTPLALLAELYLSEMANFPGREHLPEEGVLQFWFDRVEPPDGQLDASRVVWHPDIATLFQVEAWPSALPPGSRFPRAAVRFLHPIAGDDPPTATDTLRHGLFEGFDLFAGLRAIRARVGTILPVALKREPEPALEADAQASPSLEFVEPQARVLLRLEEEPESPDGPAIPFRGGPLSFLISDDDLAARRFDRATYNRVA